MKTISKILFYYAFIFLVTFAYSAVNVDSAIKHILSSRSFKDEQWYLVEDQNEKFVSFYDGKRQKFNAYLAQHNPELLDKLESRIAEVEERIFLVFQKKGTDIYRAGWIYRWKPLNECANGDWDYEWNEIHENEVDPVNVDHGSGSINGWDEGGRGCTIE